MENALADVLEKTDDLNYIRVGIMAADFHRGGSMRLAEDSKKRAILEKAIDKYNAKTDFEKWELMRCDDGSYFTANTISMP